MADFERYNVTNVVLAVTVNVTVLVVYPDELVVKVYALNPLCDQTYDGETQFTFNEYEAAVIAIVAVGNKALVCSSRTSIKIVLQSTRIVTNCPETLTECVSISSKYPAQSVVNE